MAPNTKDFNWGEYYTLQATLGTPYKVAEDNDKFYYLATPYSKFMEKEVKIGLISQEGAFEEAYQAAAEMLMFLECNKLFVFCPIVHSHDAVKYAPDLHTHEFWLNIDFKFIRISRGLIVCTMAGWKESYGITEEIKYAETLGLPVYYTSFMELPEFGPK